MEDSETRRVHEDKSWRVRNLDDEDVGFSSLQVGENVLAYWSHNKEYFEATIVEKSDSSGKGAHSI